MICQELDSIEPEAFHTELVKCLADFYENIRDMEGAGGLHVAKSFKRKFKAIHEIIYVSASSSQPLDGNDSNGEDAQDGEDATDGAPEGASAASAAAPAAAPADTAPPSKKAPATRGKGTGRG